MTTWHTAEILTDRDTKPRSFSFTEIDKRDHFIDKMVERGHEAWSVEFDPHVHVGAAIREIFLAGQPHYRR